MPLTVLRGFAILLNILKPINCILLLVLMAASTVAYAQAELWGDVDKQWLCENKQTIREKAELWDTAALYHAGMMHFNGFCVNKNLPAAYRFFVTAAEGGHIKSYHIVAVMSHIGLGTKPDVVNANKIFLELLKVNYPLTVRYACDIQKGEDERLNAFPKLESLSYYKGCKS